MEINETLESIRSELKLIRSEIAHNTQLLEQRLDAIEKDLEDHEMRLRSVTEGVTQFRFWASLGSGGSLLASLTALVKSCLR